MLLSVVVPAYNQAQYIGDALASLVGGKSSLGYMYPQTLRPDEIIIADDASTDDTYEAVMPWLEKHPRIRYFRQQNNIGSPANYNLAIREARGKYITLLAADDIREMWSLEQMMNALQIEALTQETTRLWVYDHYRVFVDGVRGQEMVPLPYTMDNLLRYNVAITGCVLFPKAAWEAAGGYPESMSAGREDWAFHVAMATHGWHGVHAKHPGYLYRREGQGKSVDNATPERLAYFRDKMRQLFPDHYANIPIEEMM